MGTGYLVDTNIIIGYLDNKIDLKGMEFMHPIIDKTPIISFVNKIEILRFNTTSESYKILEDFINSSRVIGLNEEIVDLSIVICKGSRIKLPDAIIAATAISYNLTLLTRNTSDFKKIAGLDFLNPWDIS